MISPLHEVHSGSQNGEEICDTEVHILCICGIPQRISLVGMTADLRFSMTSNWVKWETTNISLFPLYSLGVSRGVYYSQLEVSNNLIVCEASGKNTL